jgi:transcriptional regulator GlxA family with amidase domain
LKLSEPICVADLARQLDVSHNHLTRLFNRYCQQNVVAYITARRIERARHLLIHSTLPIKAVAAQVGFHNLQDFNKMLRRNTGLAPRALRVQSSTRF